MTNSRLYVAKWITVAEPDLLRSELVRFQFVLGIKLKGYMRRHWLQRFCIDVVNCGCDEVGITGAFHRETLRTEVKQDTRFRRARRQLGIQCFINLLQAPVRSVRAFLTSGRGHRHENSEQEKACEKND
jgi:hypothetical protein